MGYFEGEVVATAIDHFMLEPELQVEYGCRWLVMKKKRVGPNCSDSEMLRRYNGGGDATYVPRVFAKYTTLQKELK
jgi:hypothetical protein